MGSGLSMEGDEIAFKCNFAYMNPDSKIVEKRRVDRYIFDIIVIEILKNGDYPLLMQ